MNYSTQLASYKNAAVTVQKTKQVVLLYDAVIRFLQQAKAAIERKDFNERLTVLEKATNIISGLHNSLDHQSGGDVAKTLDSFYSDIEIRVMRLNRTNDVVECDTLVSEIKSMREAWDEIDKKYATGQLEISPEIKPLISEDGSANFSA